MKICAVCGNEPKLTASDMGRDNGHGYPGSTDYLLECEGCGLFRVSADDIYDDSKEEKAGERVVRYWNDKMEEIQKLISKKARIEGRNQLSEFELGLLIQIVEESFLAEKHQFKLIERIKQTN